MQSTERDEKFLVVVAKFPRPSCAREGELDNCGGGDAPLVRETFLLSQSSRRETFATTYFILFYFAVDGKGFAQEGEGGNTKL